MILPPRSERSDDLPPASGGGNLVLIGMPGAGKSTLGVLLAKRTRRNFLDTDLLIQLTTGMSLQEIVDSRGEANLREIEEATVLTLEVNDHVIATGGSVVYSAEAMSQLRSLGRVIHLDVPCEVLQSRLQNFGTRGIARKPGQTLQDLYEERHPLYERYADLTIPCDNLPPEVVVEQILQGLADLSA